MISDCVSIVEKCKINFSRQAEDQSDPFMMAPFPVAPSRSNNDHEVVSTARTISDTNPFKNGSSFDVSKKLNPR